ncbi:MAG TPA: hypothetical protein VFW07_08715 [Parafilimonas sp.]|nr:hypothetical protein [Parafilimonas sp.]
MEKENKVVEGKVSFEEAEDADVEYWANLPVKERLRQAFIWNRKVWKHILNDDYPEKINLSGGKQVKSLTDEDDF